MISRIHNSFNSSTSSDHQDQFTKIKLWYMKSMNVLSVKIIHNSPNDEKSVLVSNEYRPFNATGIPLCFFDEILDCVQSFNSYCLEINLNTKIQEEQDIIMNLVNQSFNEAQDTIDW